MKKIFLLWMVFYSISVKSQIDTAPTIRNVKYGPAPIQVFDFFKANSSTPSLNGQNYATKFIIGIPLFSLTCVQ